MPKKHDPRRKNLRLGRISAAMALAGLVAAACTSSGWLWRQNEEGPLWVRVATHRWLKVSEIGRGELAAACDVVLADERISFSQLHLRRQSHFRLNIFAFKPETFLFQTVFKPEFMLTTQDEMGGERPALIFIINANYFDEDFQPLGWVVHEGRTFNREAGRFDGYFLVTDDLRPVVGSREQRVRARGRIREAVQSYPLLLEDYRVREDVLRGKERLTHAAERTWRVLIGQLADDTLIFLASDAGCIVDLHEMVQLAGGLNIRNAMALDGGGSVQYSLRYGDTAHSFSVRGRKVPVFVGITEKSD
ncbi:MAG: phosphodiester glycosidase family protein [Acidobacteria bacterium]|nr:phosphodiester glycosidase family protein [Acidobacteriota bacterium]